MFLYFFQLRQLSPEPGSGGGNNYTLDDLDNDEDDNKDDNSEGKSEEELKAEKEAAEAEEQRLADEKAKADKILADKEEAKRLEDEQKQKNADKGKTTDDAGQSDDDDEDDFWAEVDKLRGEAVEVDYGDVDPVSPEGALIRENALIEKAIGEYDDFLEQNQPRAYAYLKHVMNGGTDEEFFQMTAGTEDLPTAEQLENDIELQKAIVTRDMKERGNSDKTIASVIKALITDDELEESAKEALVNQEKVRDQKLVAVKEESDRRLAEKQTALNKMGTYVSQVVSTGVIDNITIPEKDRKPFIDHFNKNVRYENGKFLLVTELSDENVLQNFKKEFFNFKGGKIEELVEKQARTQNAKRLVKTIGQDKRVKGAGDDSSSGFVALGDL